MLRAALRTAALAGALVALGWGAAAPATAAEGIRSYAVDVAVQQDGTLLVTERIDYDFGSDERRGIIRDIPTQDTIEGGSTIAYEVSDPVVTIDGAPATVQVTRESGLVSVRIGDAEVFLTGAHDYRISYSVGGALRRISPETAAEGAIPGLAAGDVEFYWDLIGDAWDVPIARASARVTGPATPLGIRCFTGPIGKTTPCPWASSGRTATFGPVQLDPGEALTAGIAYPGSAFDAAAGRTITVPQPGEQVDPTVFLIIGVAVLLPLALLPVLAFAVPVLVAWGRRRRTRGAALDLAPVQFGPPDDLRPAQVAAGLVGAVDARTIVATLLDLAARRWIVLTSLADGPSGSRIDVAWWGAGTDALLPWEDVLLAGVLRGQVRGSIGGYDPALATAVGRVSWTLRSEAVAAGRFNPASGRARNAMIVVALCGVVAIFAVAIIGALVAGPLALPYAVVLGGSLTAGGLVGRKLTPLTQTPTSGRFAAQAEGFKRFLDTDPATARRELAHRLGLPDYAVFATMLPYAVIFNLESSWSGAFPDLTPEELRDRGLNVSRTAVLTDLVSSGLHSVSAASEYPSSTGRSSASSDSSFSSGGGFSGGGGGGGGGRSW